MVKKTPISSKNQLSFDMFLKPAAKPVKATMVQPTTPNTQARSILSENRVTGVAPDLTYDAASASHDTKKTEGIAHEGIALRTGYGNAVVVPKPSGGRMAKTRPTHAEKKRMTLTQAIAGSKPVPPILPLPKTDGTNVDLSNYQSNKLDGPRIRKDGFVYFCREGKHHFIGPVIINTSIKHNDPYFDVLTCPVCGSAAINNVSFNAIPDPAGIGKDFCRECGCVTEIDIRGSDTKICYNCNRDLETIKLDLENQK